MNHAEELGIDLDSLERERFGTPEHYEQLRKHLDRVRAYELAQKYLETERRLETLAAEAKAEPKPEVVRRRRGRPRKQPRTYEFTDRQLEIALRSIERHAGNS